MSNYLDRSPVGWAALISPDRGRATVASILGWWEHRLRGVSELLRQAQAPRMSLYRHFLTWSRFGWNAGIRCVSRVIAYVLQTCPAVTNLKDTPFAPDVGRQEEHAIPSSIHQDVVQIPPSLATPIRTALFSSGQTFADMNVIWRKSCFESNQKVQAGMGREDSTTTDVADACNEKRRIWKMQYKIRSLSLRNQWLEARLGEADQAAATTSQHRVPADYLVQQNAFLESSLHDVMGCENRLRECIFEFEKSAQASDCKIGVLGKILQQSAHEKTAFERALQDERQQNRELERTIRKLQKEDELVKERNRFLEALYQSGSVLDKTILDMLNDKDDRIQALKDELETRRMDSQVPTGSRRKIANTPGKITQLLDQFQKPGPVLEVGLAEVEGVAAASDEQRKSENVFETSAIDLSKLSPNKPGTYMTPAITNAVQSHGQLPMPHEHKGGTLVEGGPAVKVVDPQSQPHGNTRSKTSTDKNEHTVSNLSTLTALQKPVKATQLTSWIDSPNSVGYNPSPSSMPTDSSSVTDSGRQVVIGFCDTSVPKSFGSLPRKLHVHKPARMRADDAPKQGPEPPKRTRTQKRNGERRRFRQRRRQKDGQGEIGQRN